MVTKETEFLYAQAQRKVADQIDFSVYLTDALGEEVYDIMQKVQNDYDSGKLIISAMENKLMQGNVFNWWDEYEFSIYLKDKYKLHIHEENITRFIIVGMDE